MTRKHDYKLIAYLYKAGYSQGDIAAIFDSVSGHISKVLKKEGVAARPRGQKVVPVPYEKFPDAVQKAAQEVGITARVQKVSEVRKGKGAAVKGGSNKEVKGNTGWSESKKKEAREYLMVYLYKAGYSVRAVEILTETKNGEKVLDKYQVSRRKEDVEDAKLTPYTDFPDKVKKIIDVLGLTDWIKKSTQLRITGKLPEKKGKDEEKKMIRYNPDGLEQRRMERYEEERKQREAERKLESEKERMRRGTLSKEDEEKIVKQLLEGWIDYTRLSKIDLSEVKTEVTGTGVRVSRQSKASKDNQFKWINGDNIHEYYDVKNLGGKTGKGAVSYVYGKGVESIIDPKISQEFHSAVGLGESIKKDMVKRYGVYNWDLELRGVNGVLEVSVALSK
ncbi:hypothetical protein [Bacillus sp. NEAU-Y102]